ncbi:MAG: type II toxin-antitoxin system Phd/YefM family antitoxin [Mycobacterium sp.]
MKSVTVRELRNKGGEVLDRVQRGERVVVTRDGRPIAELRPLPQRSARPEELIERWKRGRTLTPKRCNETSTPSSIRRCDGRASFLGFVGAPKGEDIPNGSV